MSKPIEPKQMLVSSGEDEATLMLYGDIYQGAHIWSEYGIVDGVDSIDVAQALKGLPANVSKVNVRIQSYGGEVAEGLAIYNALRSSGKEVETVVDGFACSIASVVFMAGDTRTMSASSLLMVHSPWVFAEGNAEQLREQADALDKIAEASVAAYKRGGATEEKVRELMSRESWITPQEALDMGLATQVADDPEPSRTSQSARKAFIQQFRPKEATVAANVFTAESEEFKRAVKEAVADALKPEAPPEPVQEARPEPLKQKWFQRYLADEKE